MANELDEVGKVDDRPVHDRQRRLEERPRRLSLGGNGASTCQCRLVEAPRGGLADRARLEVARVEVLKRMVHKHARPRE